MKTEGIITSLMLALKVLARISFAAVAFAFTGEALAQSPITLTLEKLEPGWTNDYGGLQWTNFSLLDGAHYNPPSGYKQAVVSPAHVVLNAYTHPAELTKSDGSFNLLSAYLTGAWNDRLQVQVAGFYDNTLLYSNKWVFATKTRRPLASSPAIGADGVVYIGSWDGNLYAVDGVTGQKRWQVFLGDMIDASPAIARDGTVFIGSWNGWFCAINSDSPGLMESSWPKFKGGPLSVGRLGRCPQ